MKIKFGINLKKVKTGAELHIMLFQLAALFSALYLYIISGYPYLMTQKGVLLYLFDLGITALPRWEALLLSLLYRSTFSEIAVCLSALGFALIVGIAAANVLKDNPRAALTSRIVLAGLIVGDLVFRLLPLPCNQALDPGWNAAGFVIRLICLALVALDLIAHRRAGAAD